MGNLNVQGETIPGKSPFGMMREVFIISTGQVIHGKNAASQRVMNIARSLAAGEVNVFICSLPQIRNDLIESIELSERISYLKSKENKENSFFHLLKFVHSVNGFIKNRNSESAIYLYPTTFILRDFIYLLYFKIIKGYKFFCEINELRVAIVYSSNRPERKLHRLKFYLKSSYDFIRYKLNEFQVPLYDGIIVISSNLEIYFSRLAKNILKVPILCDPEKIQENKSLIYLNGSPFKICYAGYIKCEKEGFNILFDALRQVNQQRDVELYLYGTLPSKDNGILNHLINIYKITDKVFYMGNFDPDYLLKEFLNYHLLILPRPLNSRTKYGFSTKLSEYLISGVPVLVTDVSDNAVYIEDNYNGFVIPPGSTLIMVDKILEIIENYNKNANNIIKNAILTAKEKFDYHIYSNALIGFIFN